MSKICLNCGHNNSDLAKFCVRCGTRLSEVPDPEKNPPEGEADKGATILSGTFTAAESAGLTDTEHGGNVSDGKPEVQAGIRPETAESAEGSDKTKAAGNDEAADQANNAQKTGGGETAFETGPVETGGTQPPCTEPENSDPLTSSGQGQGDGKISAEWNGTEYNGNAGAQPSVRPEIPSGSLPGAPGPSSGENPGYFRTPPFTTANGTPYYRAPSAYPQPGFSPAQSQEFVRMRQEALARRAKMRALAKRKTLFVLAFIGLLLDFVFGIGALMCLPVAIVASVEAGRLYRLEKKTSTQLLWAMIIGYVGSLLGFTFLFLVI